MGTLFIGFFGLFWSCALAAPTLKSVQVVWRHGDRTPLGTYNNDPYQESYWGLPWGTLTTLGMEQQYQNGLKLKQRYIDNFKLVNATYVPNQIYIRTADTDRCIISASSNLAGFYSDSSFYPQGQKWPGQWTPVPIHSLPKALDNVLEPGEGCARVDILYAERVAHKNFLEYLEQHLNLLAEIYEKSGNKITDIKAFYRFFDTVVCERDHNLTLPAWITNDFYNQCEQMKLATEDFANGMPAFGVPEQEEIVMLRGGPAIQTLTGGITKPKGKYHVYSAHDVTVVAILYTLGVSAKYAALGKGQPDYASTLAFEVYQMDDGSESVKVLYAANSAAPFLDITHSVAGCPSADFCPTDVFIAGRKKYIPSDWKAQCEKL